MLCVVWHIRATNKRISKTYKKNVVKSIQKPRSKIKIKKKFLRIVYTIIMDICFRKQKQNYN